MVKHTQKLFGKLPTNCLSVFDHFVRLVLKGLTIFAKSSIIYVWQGLYTMFDTLLFYGLHISSLAPWTPTPVQQKVLNTALVYSILFFVAFQVHIKRNRNLHFFILPESFYEFLQLIFNAGCPVKGHTYSSKPAASSCEFFLSMYDL